MFQQTKIYDKERIIRALILARIPKLGPILLRKILNWKDLDHIFDAKESDWEELEFIRKKGASYIYRILKDKDIFQRARKEFDFIQNKGLHFYFIEDANFPLRLKQCPDTPIVFFGEGQMDLNIRRVISIVGTRKATAYGKKLTYDFLETLASLPVLVISGLAYGIDITAHKASMDLGIPTVGVLAHGLDNLYPSEHREISQRMKIHGGLVTEFWSETNLQPGLFPRRNRIIAGLCDALIVMEAAEKGGALISAGIANSYDREVFAFPGRVNDLYSKGCLQLIRDQEAQLILNGEDFLNFMNWERNSIEEMILSKEGEKDEINNADRAYELSILLCLQKEGIICKETIDIQFPELGSKIYEILLSLEIQNKIKSLPGGSWELI